jgi:hypothetical protein
MHAARAFTVLIDTCQSGSYCANIGARFRKDCTGNGSSGRREKLGQVSEDKVRASAPQISLPKGGGAISGIGEKFAEGPRLLCRGPVRLCRTEWHTMVPMWGTSEEVW